MFLAYPVFYYLPGEQDFEDEQDGFYDYSTLYLQDDVYSCNCEDNSLDFRFEEYDPSLNKSDDEYFDEYKDIDDEYVNGVIEYY